MALYTEEQIRDALDNEDVSYISDIVIAQMQPIRYWHSENPLIDGDYICRMDDGYIKLCHYQEGEWSDMWKEKIEGFVMKWMYIPYDKINK